MRTIAGKAVCETVEELTQPDVSAFVLVDVQNDYLAANGLDARRGEFGEACGRGIVGNIARLLERARELGVLVVYVRYTRQKDHRYESPATLRWMFVKRGYREDDLSTVEGSWGWQIIDELKPRSDELIVDKRRPSGFHETSLHARLQEHGIKTVILVGVSTHGCVEATARDAELRNYYVVPVVDCMGAYDNALHEAALTVMQSRYDVLSTGELLDAWTKRRHR